MEIEYNILYKHISDFICKIYQIYDLNQYCDYNTLIDFHFTKIEQNKQSNYILIDNNENFICILICLTGKKIELIYGTYEYSKNGEIHCNSKGYIDLFFELVESIVNIYYNIFETYFKEHENMILYKNEDNYGLFNIIGTNLKHIYKLENIPSNIELYKLNNLELTIFPES
uniref:Uncharacterized protein n=1 Tax=Pithovirus LCDPAC02 TaxID=2506601 RepID=A0A481YNS6_9VIRU|nr:MAG: hypothetical protein LCDPAC02_01100 [Pithovirus LCDPAC02]